MPDLKEIIKTAQHKGLSKKQIQQALIKKGYLQEEIENAFPSKAKQNYTQVSLSEKIKLLFNPNEFFKTVREPTISKSLLMLLVVTVCAFIIRYLFNFVLYASLSKNMGFPLQPFSGILSGVLGIFAFALSFVFALIIHGVAKLFKGTGSYIDSYNAVAYGMIPAAVFSVIPYVGFLAGIYSIIFSVFGISEYHKLSKGKAVAAVLAPIIITLILIVILAIYVITIFRGGF